MAKNVTVTDKDLGLKRILAEVRRYNYVAVTVGVHQGQRNSEGLDIAEYGAYNEFGEKYKRIPERSFMRSTFDENSSKYVDIFYRGIKQLGERATIGRVLSFAGMNIQNDIQLKIRSRIEPPNSLKTIKRKKSDKTLIDTGALVQSITYEITKK